ncbi:MAG: type I-E CRISPR-associated protein Cas7/Cse4/CasC [Faecalibacterium sp.]
MLYEIHMIKNYPPANLNRDDTGSPKTSYFGGSLRGRISSQCLKRSWRTSALFDSLLGDRGIRSRQLPDLVKDELILRGMSEAMAEIAKEKVTGIGNKDGKENEKGITSQTMFFSAHDVSAVANIMIEAAADKDEKSFKKAKTTDIVKQMKNVALRPITIDIAMFGRMVTSDAFHNVEAAVQTAHAISTHTVNQENDYFTAMDDLLGAADTGADMVGDTEYNACCYYHYMSIDTDQLEKNLKDSPDAQAHIAALLPAMVEIMAFSNPSGKQNSFASHVLPEAMYIEVKNKKVPTSYANAFETPVRFGSNAKVLETSVKNLVKEINLIEESYQLEKTHRAWFAPRYNNNPEMLPTGAQSMHNFKDLLTHCETWTSK